MVPANLRKFAIIEPQAARVDDEKIAHPKQARPGKARKDRSAAKMTFPSDQMAYSAKW